MLDALIANFSTVEGLLGLGLLATSAQFLYFSSRHEGDEWPGLAQTALISLMVMLSLFIAGVTT